MKSGNLMRKQLGKRDRAIIGDVLRYRIITNEIVHCRYLPDATMNAVTKITARLALQGYLARHSLLDQRVYYVAGRVLCRQLGLPRSRSSPLGLQALAGTLSIANYCLMSRRSLNLLSADDFKDEWAWIPEKLRSLPSVIEQINEQNILRIIRVDFGGAPAHIARKCKQDIERRISVTRFRDMLEKRQILFVVITTTDLKRKLVMHAIRQYSWPSNLRFEIINSSDLRQITIS